MKCVICRNGETEPGTTTVTFERDGCVVVIRGVPAEVCANCGESYTDEQITAQLLGTASQEIEAGVLVQVRDYSAA